MAPPSFAALFPTNTQLDIMLFSPLEIAIAPPERASFHMNVAFSILQFDPATLMAPPSLSVIRPLKRRTFLMVTSLDRTSKILENPLASIILPLPSMVRGLLITTPATIILSKTSL